MPLQFAIQDLVISLGAQHLTPTVVHPDLLRYSGVIPADWALDDASAYTPNAVKLVFKNGVQLLADGNQLMFVERVLDKPADSLLTPALAQRYIQAFPRLGYQKLSLNLRGYLPITSIFPHGQYLAHALLSDGPWRQDCLNTVLNLTYPGLRTPLHLSITEAALQQENAAPSQILLFSGKYHYPLTGDTPEAMLDNLNASLNQVSDDLTYCVDLAGTRFLPMIAPEPFEGIETAPVLCTTS